MSCLDDLLADWRENPRDYKARLVLIGFRICRGLYLKGYWLRPLYWTCTAVYRILTEGILGIELRPKTDVGAGLRIYHGFGLVVNDHTVIGRSVILRNGVTIGHKRAGEGSPTIQDDVDVGANSTVIGEIVIGRGTTIGAGAVVTKSTPEGSVWVGNPARRID